MAYRRNSSGFMSPVSGRQSRGEFFRQGGVSGPGRSNVGLSREDLGPRPRTAADKRILASFSRAQKAHEGVMAGIAKAESDKFKRINDALTASREVDAKNKDALGNALPPSPQTAYLQAQLQNIMGQASQRAGGLTPERAGVTPEQEGELKKGPGGPGGGRYDIGGSDYIPGIPGSRDLLQRGPTTGRMAPVPGSLEPGDPSMAPGEPEVFAMDTPATTNRGDKVTLKGQQRIGPDGPEYLVVTEDGREAWLPRASFKVAEEPGKGRGAAGLLRHFEKPVGDFQPF